MGKRIIARRSGRGTPTYSAHSFRWGPAPTHRAYDDKERSGVITGVITNMHKYTGYLSPVAEIQYEDKSTTFMFAPLGVKVRDTIQSGALAPPQTGNTLPLGKIPEGMPVYNIELNAADGGKLVRAPGTSARIIASSPEKVTVLLPSKKQKELNPACRATIGTIAGAGRRDKPFVTAGARHHLMRSRGKLYPHTSGVAMNAVDHPFGSGRGRHIGKSKTPSRFAPAGAKVGLIGARRTGRKR